MTIKPLNFSPIPMAKLPSYMPDFRPRVFNEELFNGSGEGIAALGDAVGSERVMKDGAFDSTMLKALDKVSGYQQKADYMIQQALIDPESVDVHDIANAQAQANMSLNMARTILNRVVQSWKDIINTR
ncbi:MAG: flagellar hook-basal body complex protein FliE [Treponema sp.]|jgi:flagellar hook-basal body complex protein FliE|nr:flagellar hook-basal body complex protein FliE [Treponema sp.]